MNERSTAYSEIFGSSPDQWNPNLASVQESPRVIDSLLHPLAVLIRQVLTRPGRLELNLILIDDEENIIQALDAGVVLHSLYYSGEKMLSNELTRKLPAHTGVYEVTKRTCKKIFENDKVSRVFAIAHTPAALSLSELLETQRDLVALEDLTISGNIGAIVRTSLAFAVGGVILLNADPVDIYDRRLIRASRGHIFSLPVVTATTEEMIRFCQDNDLPMLAMASQGADLIQDAAALPRRLVIILGSEKEGCSERLREAATLQVKIPTYPKVESLNVSTAAAIMLYHRLGFNHPQVRK